MGRAHRGGRIPRFQEPRAFKESYKNRGHPDTDWHHIVEKDADFPDEWKHNTLNMVKIPRAKHWAITQFYSTPNEEYGWLTPREWLRGQSFEVHRDFGIAQLCRFGALK
jgi:hypothetical protein